jgi:DNA-binding LytR/AlgR family response regulator
VRVSTTTAMPASLSRDLFSKCKGCPHRVAAVEYGGRLTLPTPQGVRVVRIADIVTVASCENYTELRLAAGERLFVRRTMKAWMEHLPAGSFHRVHRHTIINLERLRGWRRLNNDTSLMSVEGCRQAVRASYRYLRGLREKLGRWVPEN